MGVGALGVALGVIALGVSPALAASTWTIASGAVPAGANQTSLRAVTCTGATACMAVGEKTVDPGDWANGTTLVEHWNGTTWTVLPSPNPPGARRSVLLGVSCTKPTRCTAVGASTPDDGNSYTTLVERWNGTAWKIVKSPNTVAKVNLLYAVSCISTTNCTAVGSAQPDGSSSTTLVESWNGTVWTVVANPNPAGYDQRGQSQFVGVSCTGAGGCTAIGSSNNYATGGGEKMLIEHSS